MTLLSDILPPANTVSKEQLSADTAPATSTATADAPTSTAPTKRCLNLLIAMLFFAGSAAGTRLLVPEHGVQTSLTNDALSEQLNNALKRTTLSINTSASHVEPIAPKTAFRTKMTIVCQLAGEMGNNIGFLSYCLSLKMWLESGEFDLKRDETDIGIIIRHQDHRKWVRGASDMHRCFPNTRKDGFAAANTQDFVQIFDHQNEVFGLKNRWKRGGGATPFDDINACGNDSQVKRAAALSHFVASTSNKNTTSPTVSLKSNISTPFLYARNMALSGTGSMLDRYYNELRRYFHFDRGACCRLLPEADESVFHFRNFLHEMPRQAIRKGFVELEPAQVATDLFGHLHPGDKVAIITRFAKQAQLHKHALEARGLQVRVIEGQHGVEDFCFMMSAKKEIIGAALSTYFLWGAILSNATRVVAYSVTSSTKGHIRYFSDPKLKSKFLFPYIKPLERNSRG